MNRTSKNIHKIKFLLKAIIFVFIFLFTFTITKNIAKAADTLVSVVDGALYAKNALAGPYWLDTDKAAIIFINGSQDMYYASTTDAGANWSSSSVMTGTVKHAASWFDQETPGDSGTLVHMAWVNRITDGIYYNTVDINSGQLGTQRTVDSSVTVDDVSSHRMAISKTVSGNLILCFSTLVEVGCYKSTDAGVNWTAIADAYETASESDWLMLYPADTGDDDDAMGIFWDVSASELSIKMYDNSANSWTETSIATSMANASSYMNMDAVIRHSDNHILLAAWNAVDTPNADFLTWDLTVDSISSPTVTAKTNVLTDQIDAAQAGMVINQQNDDIYLAYLKGTAFTATVDVVYKKSTDGMATWGVETTYSEGASDDFRIVDGGHTIDNDGGYIQFSFFEDDLNNLFVNLNNDVAIAAVTNLAPNAPTLVSPANASYTNDSTPTLSASYSDSDSGDVGTTNYRVSSSSLADCVSNSNIVASGTSAETATNSENTSYTPGASIGSDGTYYWCAQNNDGVATSAWTQMGSFILDTDSPAVSSFSPSDGASDVGIDSDLVITFDEVVSVASGNINIYKSDGSLWQSISTGDVSGSGSNTITINPSGSLGISQSYYVLIDASFFDDTAGNSYAGISSADTWNFTTLYIASSVIRPPYVVEEPFDESPDAGDSDGEVVSGEKPVDENVNDVDGSDEEVIMIYENKLIKYLDDPKVYLVEGNKKRWIVDEYTFNSLAYNWSDINIIVADLVFDNGQDLQVVKSKYNFTTYLSLGSIGQEVRDLQTLLKNLGYFNYPSITGYYGPITAEAVRNFQRDYDIDPLGVVGPQTRARLNSF